MMLISGPFAFVSAANAIMLANKSIDEKVSELEELRSRFEAFYGRQETQPVKPKLVCLDGGKK